MTTGRDGRPSGSATVSASTSEASFAALLDEFRRAWLDGERPRAESFLSRLDGAFPFQAAELIFHEYRLAREAGIEADPASFLKRFPEHKESLGRLFALDQNLVPPDLADWAAAATMPEVGDEVGSFRLVRLLGKGGFATVFLAEMADLSDALCVVKISTRTSSEPHLLARLRHGNIVEVTRQAKTVDGSLQLVCMPFLGGATLADLLKRMRSGRRPATGGDVLKLLDDVSPPGFGPSDESRPARDAVARLSAPKAFAWVVARIAEALDHADRRGVNHGDVKPSNVLFAGDGSPRLFDFNLATDREDRALVDGEVEQVGGTLVYMSPERLDALRPARRDRPRGKPQPLRADLYSLGLVLLELTTDLDLSRRAHNAFGTLGLVAELFEERRVGASAFSKNLRRLPAGLRPICEMLLAADPADRYAKGGELAKDLDLWIDDRPPEFARRPGGVASAVMFVSRRKAAIAVAGLILGTAVAVISYVRMREERAAADAMVASATSPRSTKLHVVRVFPNRGGGGWQHDPEEKLSTEDLLEEARGPYVRDRFGFRRLDAELQDEIEVITLERFYWHASTLAERAESPSDWSEALALVDWVIQARPLDPFLRLRVELETKLGQDLAGAAPVDRLANPPPAWLQRYAEGVAQSPRHARKAYKYFKAVLAEKPGFFWATHRIAALSFRLGAISDARDYLTHCVKRRPDDPNLRTQLAMVLVRLREFATAQAECEQAVNAFKNHEDALNILAVIRNLSNQNDDELIQRIARQKANKVVEQKAEQKRLDLIVRLRCARILGVKDMQVDPVLLEEVVRTHPGEQTARVALATYHFNTGRLRESIAGFGQVLERNPDHLWARYSLARVLAAVGEVEESVCAYKELVGHDQFEELFREAPDAYRCFDIVIWNDLGRGRCEEAWATAEAWRSLATEREANPALALFNRGMAAAAAARGEDEFLLAGVTDLFLAEIAKPGVLESSYAKDDRFQPYRAKLAPYFKSFSARVVRGR